MLTVNAYAAPSATEPLVPTTIERRDVGPHDVLIDIAYAGICHSDIHTVRGEWGADRLPAGRRPRDRRRRRRGRLRGHAARGRRPRRRRLHGQLLPRVRELPRRRGAVLPEGQHRHLRRPSTATAPSPRAATPRTSSSSRTSCCACPESIPYEAAAPLLCAGITTYSPLAHWKAGPGKRVAVVGLGGLGHMAVKIAHAMGAEVTVLSQTLSKKEDGLALGADHYYATSDPETFDDAARTPST